jgi:hypothetical protein
MLSIDWVHALSSAASHSVMVSAMFVGFALCAVALPAVWSSDEKRRRDARKVLRSWSGGITPRVPTGSAAAGDCGLDPVAGEGGGG